MKNPFLYTFHISLLKDSDSTPPLARYFTNASPPHVGDKMNLKGNEGKEIYICRVVEITFTPASTDLGSGRRASLHTDVHIIVVPEREET
jgi:hypothetical protein